MLSAAKAAPASKTQVSRAPASFIVLLMECMIPSPLFGFTALVQVSKCGE
jgi:hypothetical protein